MFIDLYKGRSIELTFITTITAYTSLGATIGSSIATVSKSSVPFGTAMGSLAGTIIGISVYFINKIHSP